MQTLLISGNCGRDSELRTTQGGDDVLSFSVGVRQGYKDDAPTVWYRCNVWGKRARPLKDKILKGVKVVVHGELTIGEYQDKPQYDVRVSEVEIMSRADQNANRQERAPERQSQGGYQSDLDDDVPF